MSEFSTKFWWRPQELRNADSQHHTRESNYYNWHESRNMDPQHRTRECNYYRRESQNTESQYRNRECNYYDWRVVRRDEV